MPTPSRFLFVGCPIDAHLAEALDCCRERDRVFLQDPAYLESLTVDGAAWIGRRCVPGAAVDAIEDVARNVASLLRRLAPDAALQPADLLIVALEDENLPIPTSEPGEDEATFAYADLIG